VRNAWPTAPSSAFMIGSRFVFWLAGQMRGVQRQRIDLGRRCGLLDQATEDARFE
jgi:hypothetical protein